VFAPGLRRRCFYGIACLLPGGETTEQGLDVGESSGYEILCHTGTLLLLASGAVENDLFVLGQFAQSGGHLCFRDGDRSCGMACIIQGLAANIHQHSLTLL
jgi:hypothetical protein